MRLKNELCVREQVLWGSATGISLISGKLFTQTKQKSNRNLNLLVFYCSRGTIHTTCEEQLKTDYQNYMYLVFFIRESAETSNPSIS